MYILEYSTQYCNMPLKQPKDHKDFFELHGCAAVQRLLALGKSAENGDPLMGPFEGFRV